MQNKELMEFMQKILSEELKQLTSAFENKISQELNRLTDAFENKIDQKLKPIKTDLESLSKKVDKIDQIETQLKKLDTRLKKIETHKLNSIMEQVAHNSEQISVVHGELKELKNVVQRIESTQEKQEKTIDLLARRSIDHEAQLKQVR